MQKILRPTLADLTGLERGEGYCIVGAPGTGKTSTLIELVLELEKIHPPEQILVLTASRQQASRLRDQIGIASKRASSKPRAQSVTGFAFAGLQDSGQDHKLLTGAMQERILRRLVSENEQALRQVGLNSKSTQLAAFIQELRDLLQVVLDFELKTQDLVQLQTEFPKLKLGALLVIFEKYLEVLEAENLVDPSTLLTRAAQLPASHSIVLVDDAQEFSTAGLKLLRQLIDITGGVIFGDPDSGTQGYRAAEPGSFLALGQNRIYLSELRTELANTGLMQKLSSRLPATGAGPQRAVFNSGSETSALIFEGTSAEADYLATQLRRMRLEDKVPFSEMAVVVRTRSQVEQLAKDLALRNVPISVQGLDEPLSKNQLSRAILDVASLINQTPNRETLTSILQSSLFSLNPIQTKRLDRLLVHHFGLRVEAAWSEAFELGVELDSFEARALNRLVDLVHKLRGLHSSSAHEVMSEIFNLAPKSLSEQSRSRAAVAAAANRDLDAVMRLFAAAIRFDQQGGQVSDFVAEQLDQRVVEDALFSRASADAVSILTPSALTGQRFDVVALPRLQDGIWPNLKLRNSMLGAGSIRSYLAGRLATPTESVRSELADELRLLYKAVGAARSRLLLSAMQSEDEQPSQFLTMAAADLSQFEGTIEFDLRKLVGRLRQRLAAGDQSAAGTLALMALADVPGSHPSNWHGILEPSSTEPIFREDEDVTLNASSLDAFEKCPVHWFVQTFAVGRKSFQASIGTLLHKALELATSPGDIQTYVESNWHELEFEMGWQERSERQRAMEMAALLAEYLASALTLVSAEEGFEIEVGRLRIRGKIDRVEATEDGLEVADLKTGKSLPDAKSSKQLAVYQLAVSKKHPDKTVLGAKLVSIGTGKLKVSKQAQLDETTLSELQVSFSEFESATSADRLIARVSEHCSADADCSILLAKAVNDG
ncbi:ATP-dependent DNA helicase [Aquiluna sp. KACHI24]|uniref:ATP-dependent DNA helicase n=1 Tax=Aquiluna sp. KACHI24 TaxID=2968831 RepID=UPI0022070E83|nr:ATP-dependent DNA helicase [Aquiluna sp. KACHI24]BDQ00023.1 DNA helicase [Aquiluna sp. KACHI24]